MKTYKNSVVNDLAWAIASPPIIAPDDDRLIWFDSPFYAGLYESSVSWFDDIDDDITELQDIIEAERDKRLGSYFEVLWAYWLRNNDRFDLLEHNLQVIVDGRTLGEFDMIVRDRATDKVQHWELAIKFYLGSDDTSRYRNWYGPHKKDRFDLKYEHLSGQQTRLMDSPEAKALLDERGIAIDEVAVILKGCLFYPYDGDTTFPHAATSLHNRSFHIRLKDFEQEFEASRRFLPLIGRGWMVQPPVDGEVSLHRDELLECVRSGDLRLPLMLMTVNEPKQSFFLTQDSW